MTQRKDRYPESSAPGDRQDAFGVRDVVASYDVGAPALVPEYENLSFEEIHASVLDLLPESTGCILDVGAGTGRDAAWFAANGHNVVAVEPSAQFRAAGQERHRSPDIRWMNDTLPALEKVLRSKLTFDLVWVSAVWMHVPRSVRARAFRKLVSVMSPGASMMFSLRQGPSPLDRPMEPATAVEVEELARRHGLQTVRRARSPDAAGRTEISWEVIWLRLPDDGTGALPLLRHIVFNDQKSSTYKLALLRTLVRIADGAGGFARPGADERHVDLPLGLVALFWIRAFKPLLASGFPQLPTGNVRLRFVKDGFPALNSTLTQRFQGRTAVQRRGCREHGPRTSRCSALHSIHARHVHHVPGERRSRLSLQARQTRANRPGGPSGRRVSLVVRHLFCPHPPVAGDEPIRPVDRARHSQRVD